MQNAFDFGIRDDLIFMYQRLAFLEPAFQRLPRRTPIHQLIRSLLGSNTKDVVSGPAFERLIAAYPDINALADAKPEDIEALIADVTRPDQKAGYVLEALDYIRHRRPDFDLRFLKDMPVSHAEAWLQDMTGVGSKVASAVLNFSLRQPAFVADTHVLRILARFGCLSHKADSTVAHNLVAGAMTDWSADDFETFHIYVKTLGQKVCEANRMACGLCPLATRCQTARTRAA